MSGDGLFPIRAALSAIDFTQLLRLLPGMRLKSFRLRNYKGHRDTGDLEIGSRFTVFIGQNNSGKSLLEALSAGSFIIILTYCPKLARSRRSRNPTSEMVQSKDADAAKLLSKLFADISDAKLEFRKTEHSVALTQFILKEDRNHFSELFACKRLVATELPSH
jgi:AAA15 family ATPase/GTPase